MDYIPWILAGWTVANMWLAGSLNPLAWWSGIASQVLWLYFDWQVGAYGLMPLAIILTVVYWRNLQRWKQGTLLMNFTEQPAESELPEISQECYHGHTNRSNHKDHQARGQDHGDVTDYRDVVHGQEL